MRSWSQFHPCIAPHGSNFDHLSNMAATPYLVLYCCPVAVAEALGRIPASASALKGFIFYLSNQNLGVVSDLDLWMLAQALPPKRQATIS
ncbi:MAG TPA: hypothetical protein ENJ79_05365 [Gammaproteobacteria bacterium]|nr:hypothetical protein [Gammaproteobacteria bacterium]